MFLVLVLLVRIIEAQNPSPCPGVFSYEPRTEEDRWYGRISVQSRDDLDGVWLKVGLDRTAELLGNWFGEAVSTDNREFTIRNPKYKLEAGPPVTVRFFVKYNSAQTIPSLTTIKLNGKKICTSDGVEATPPTLHISQIKPTNNQTSKRPTNPGSALSNKRDQDTGDFNILRPSSKPVLAKAQECGTVAVKANALISHGQNTTQGQWPWHAAIYHSSKAQLMYICGGTLVSDRHVITAAHCVTKQQTNQKLDLENLVVYLGKFSLKRFGTDVQEREIKNLHVHPNYSYRNYYNDIAVLRVETPLEVTRYVRPCCLWEGESGSRNLEERLGTVVGWGFDENREISDFLTQAQMPVVSVSTCLYSNRDFFSQFTSETTFCAGFRNGTSVCNGDSGSGMVFPTTSGQSTIWQLRGIVSVGVALQGQAVCDSTQYVVFQDVAKHLDWVKGVMRQ